MQSKNNTVVVRRGRAALTEITCDSNANESMAFDHRSRSSVEG